MFGEQVLLQNGFVIEVFFLPGKGYRLCCRKGKEVQVEYKSNGKYHSRELRGRRNAYEFRSVEQLRYDFERDAENAQRQA